MLWRASLVVDADWRRADGERLSGGLESFRAPISIRSGPLIATAISYRFQRRFVGKQRWLQSFETSFHQDLNGDGAIGVTGTVIEFGRLDQSDGG